MAFGIHSINAETHSSVATNKLAEGGVCLPYDQTSSSCTLNSSDMQASRQLGTTYNFLQTCLTIQEPRLSNCLLGHNELSFWCVLVLSGFSG